MGAKFPYAGLPPHQVWKRAVSDARRDEIDPQMAPAFRIDRTTKIASAGSCFAARIADRLREAGYTYFVTETGGSYSARYGDIYTTLQLAQLAARAVGIFAPAEPAWKRRGRYFDPLRPRVEPDGYASVRELETARAIHSTRSGGC